mmetsp:Transcript_89415/g.257900  ORF Transcript_89415/g.257900 Transcript_89415/m.257900 type:complete len:264 (-) Transcript_89415:4-795(-)
MLSSTRNRVLTRLLLSLLALCRCTVFSFHCSYGIPVLSTLYSTKDDQVESSNALSDRRVSKRWNGNYKHVSKKLCDVPKAKKLNLDLTVKHSDGSKTTKILLKKRQETLQHVLTKALLWKLYSEEYPGIEIEFDFGDPDYLPDVISLDEDGNPVFWGESGRMKAHKAIDLMQRYPKAHIVHCRWDMTLDEIAEPLCARLQELFDRHELPDDIVKRPGRFTLGALPLDMWRFIDEENGVINVKEEDVSWRELEFPTTKSPEACV